MTKTQVGASGRLLREMIGARRDAAGTGPGSGAAPRVVRRARPARSVAAGVAATGGADDGTAVLLREPTERRLGADTARWCGLYDAPAGYRCGLPEPLAAPPVPPVSDDTLRPPAPRGVHRTLGLLLAHAEPRHAAAALAALSERVTTSCSPGGGGTLLAPALITTVVVDHGDTRARAALARHPGLDARVLARLVAVGDARVAAAGSPSATDASPPSASATAAPSAPVISPATSDSPSPSITPGASDSSSSPRRPSCRAPTTTWPRPAAATSP